MPEPISGTSRLQSKAIGNLHITLVRDIIRGKTEHRIMIYRINKKEKSGVLVAIFPAGESAEAAHNLLNEISSGKDQADVESRILERKKLLEKAPKRNRFAN